MWQFHFIIWNWIWQVQPLMTQNTKVKMKPKPDRKARRDKVATSITDRRSLDTDKWSAQTFETGARLIVTMPKRTVLNMHNC